MADGIEFRYVIPTSTYTNLLKGKEFVHTLFSDERPDFAKDIVSEKNWKFISKENRCKFYGEKYEESEFPDDINYFFERMCFKLAARFEYDKLDNVSDSFVKSAKIALAMEEKIRKSPEDYFPNDKRDEMFKTRKRDDNEPKNPTGESLPKARKTMYDTSKNPIQKTLPKVRNKSNPSIEKGVENMLASYGIKESSDEAKKKSKVSKEKKWEHMFEEGKNESYIGKTLPKVRNKSNPSTVKALKDMLAGKGEESKNDSSIQKTLPKVRNKSNPSTVKALKSMLAANAIQDSSDECKKKSRN